MSNWHGQHNFAFGMAWVIDGNEAERLRAGERFKAKCETDYLEYFNDYLTIERFASDKGLSVANATALIKIGRKVNHARPSQYKGKSQC